MENTMFLLVQKQMLKSRKDVMGVYAITLLGTTLKDFDSAISWVETKLLVLLRRLHSICSLRTINSSQLSSVLQENNLEAHYYSSKDINVIEEASFSCKEGYSRIVEACILISSEPSS
ncbi:hypothetical protein SADUNF_Sadunf18G0112900 [Salix dunnii]|uniref:Uncharacterized protein n=1 Tax=Salix dunnii TaxID=1413687 RepID=A0A835J4N6_9ROSI|nr:hypothetical protein SADUNF_Sadunf18G0112900 [Salix dunnii]